jgi:hypothetical protein
MQRRKFLKAGLATIAVSSLASNLMAKNVLKTSENGSFTNQSVTIDGKKYKLSLKLNISDISGYIPNDPKKLVLEIWSDENTLEYIECTYKIQSVVKPTTDSIYNVESTLLEANIKKTDNGSIASTTKLTSMNQVPAYFQKMLQFTLDTTSFDEYLLKLKTSDSSAVSLYDDNSFYGEDCFLTSACTHSKQLPDDCYELQTLRNFRDTYMKSSIQGNELVANYYNIAPPIVRKINRLENKNEVYDYIYQTLVLPSLHYIELGEKKKAMEYYKEYTQSLNDLFN